MDRILPKILAVITGKPRYRPEIIWSSHSWTHNAFRLYELMFGRRVGIRAEATTYSDGVTTRVFIHSFEAAVAYIETFIRSLFALPKFKLVKVYIPQLVPVGFGAPLGMPYLFAIAFDATANGTAGAALSVTFAHTCTGSNLTLTVEGCQNNIPVATSSSATYNAVNVPQIVTDRNTSQNTWMDILALGGPATGANNVVWTAGDGGNGVSAFAMSLTGTAASPAGASGTVEWIQAASASKAVTTQSANSWLVSNAQINNATVTETGTGQTARTNFVGVGSNRFYGSTMTTTTVGSYTLGYSWTGNQDGTILVAEIKVLVAVAAATVSPTLLFMGIG